MIGGTQYDDWDHVEKIDLGDIHPNRYNICESEKEIVIELRDLYLASFEEINYIAFIDMIFMFQISYEKSSIPKKH